MRLFDIFRKKKPAIAPVIPLIKPAKHLTGQKIFKLNLDSLDVTECPDNTVQQQEGFWYCAALNKKNAEKHFLKMAKNAK